MREKNDWRLTNQLAYLQGAVLSWRRYSPRPGDSWEHDHCAFCWAKFRAEEDPEILHEGYATPDEYHWVCKTCFEDFRELFEWKIVA